MNAPLVSVIIPTYKRAEQLRRAIDSVLNQTYKNIEIIVVDDNDPESQDRKKTKAIMEDYLNYKNIKYITHHKNLNGSAARNTGIKNASGKYIAFLDNDDEFLPDKIQLQVEKLESLGEPWGICYTKFIRKKKNKVIDKGIEDREGNITHEILKGTFYISAGSNILIKKEIVDKIGGFNESLLRRQDLDFLVRASQYAKVAHVNKVCLIIHKDDTSNRLREDKLKENTEQFLKNFDLYISGLPKEERKKIIISQHLDLIRYYLFKLKLVSVYKICRKNDISLFIVFRYIFYLIKRKLFKQCYGFRL
jgi:glycosyltransferase involved in cell wall biosynthesis